MPAVTLGRAGTPLLIDLDICVKTGQPTRQRVTLRGRTTPSWVTILLLFTVVGFLLANAMTSRSYRITVPFTHTLHHRWRLIRRGAWLTGLAGVGALLASAITGNSASSLWVGVSVALIVAGLLIGEANAIKNTVGIRLRRDEQLVLTRAHPAFVREVMNAIVEPGLVPRSGNPA